MVKSRSRGSSSSHRPHSQISESDRLSSAVTDSGVQKLLHILGRESGLALVGGCVRDLLSSDQCTDFDLAVRFEPQKVKGLLEDAGIRVVETGIEHGTVLAVISGTHYELTTYRVPGPRQGSVYSDSLETDLSGRDFTVNAIAYDLIGNRLVDPYDGVADLERGLLRAVVNAAERFHEDPLRILRMVRFGAAAGRKIEDNTAAAAVELKEKLRSVSVERIRAELEGILMAADARAGFRALATYGLLEYTIPEMIPSIGVEQNDFHVHDVFEHTLDVISNCPVDRILRLTALFHDLGKPASLTIDQDGIRHFYLHEKISADICRSVMTRLRYSHEDIETVSLLVDTHMRPLTCGPQGVRRLIRELGSKIDVWFEFKHADKPPRGGEREFIQGVDNFQRLLASERTRVVGSVYSALAVNGDDIMRAGVAKGPLVGSILKQLQEEVLDVPERNTREYLIPRIDELVASHKN